MNRFFGFIIAVFFSFQLLAQGHKVVFTIKNYQNDTLLIGYPLGDKQYVRDTILGKDGRFVLQGEEEIQPGVYLAIMTEDGKMDYFQFILDRGEQHFELEGDGKNIINTINIKNSVNNQVFFEYLAFLNTQRKRADELKAQKENADEATVKSLDGKLSIIDGEVTDYQDDIIEKHSPKLVAALLKANKDVPLPNDIVGEDEEANNKRYLFYKKHWFDNLDLGDDRLIRTPVLFSRIEHYVEKMIVPHPDSITKELDMILSKMDKDGENFRFFVSHFLNKYAASKYVGMDAVYVHLAKNYYEKGYASWIDEEQLAKIVENANRLEPILIGKVAPDINAEVLDVEETIKRKDNEDERKRYATNGYKSLHSVDKKYTVLFVWDPDCGHCKKSMPKVVEFYQKYQDKVEIYAICNKTYKDLPECAEYIKEKIPVNWINIVDPFLTSRYKQNYDVRSTPQIFVLDKDKKILSKRIDAEQLPDIIDRLEELDEKSIGEK